MAVGARSWGVQQKAFCWANLSALFALGLAVTALTVLNSQRHYRRFDMTAARMYSLDPEVVASLRSRVTREVNVFYVRVEQSNDESIFVAQEMLRGLLREIERIRPDTIRVNMVGQETSEAEVKQLQRYFPDLQQGHIYFLCAKRAAEGGVPIDPHTKDLALADMYKGDATQGVVLAFRGESEIAQAILELVNDEPRPVYVTAGHGELFRHQTRNNSRSFHLLAQLMEGRLNVQFRDLPPGFQQVPGDARALIIPTPETNFSPVELEAIDRFAKGGGRIFLTALGPNSLTAAMGRYGIGITGDVMLLLTEANPLELPILVGSHASTLLPQKESQPSTTWMNVTEVRPLEGQGIEGWHVEPVVQSSEAVSPVPYHVVMQATRPDQVRSAASRPEKRSLAVAAHGVLQKGQKEARIVAWGSNYSLLVKNSRHQMLFQNAMSWLLEEEMPVMVPMPPIDMRPLFMNPEEFERIRWGTVVGMPLGAIVLGFGVWLRRRK